MQPKELLKSKKIRITDFRLTLLTIFNAKNQAITLNHIENELKNFDRITLYRTLKTFKEKGVIHEIAYPNEMKLYALCETNCSASTHSHQHVHFHCKKCESVLCVALDSFPALNLKGYRTDQIEIQLTGICINCN